MKKYSEVAKVPYLGPESKEPFAFKYYNPDEVIAGKKMREHLKFALSYWHTLGYCGTDMFGGDTEEKNFGETEPMAIYRAKADVAFELMEKLSIDYYCFHDADIAPTGKTMKETIDNFNTMVDYLEKKQKETGKKVLWVTANNFGDKRFMAGAATSPDSAAFCWAAAKVKACIDADIRLGGTGYVFWGGREGYDTLINTDVALELDNLARFLTMARDYARAHGYKGDFYIEPKPKEPTKHQYDFDAATCCNFLREHNLLGDFKLNIEANHATLAGHTFQHELRMARVNGAFGSIDANQGDPMLGWDTDQFPTNVYDTTLAMYEVLKEGGFTTGGLNFDAKTRRQSNTMEDILLAYIAGMDSFALGLRLALKMIEDGRIDDFIKERYHSYEEGIGKRIVEGKATLEECAEHALSHPDFAVASGRQEYLESVLNEIMFGK